MSRRAVDVIAVWRSDAVYVSRDDGEHIRPLASMVDVHDVRDVAVGARGTIFVLTDRALRIDFGDRGPTRTVRLPFRGVYEAYRIAVGHGYVAVAAVLEDDGSTRVALSDDYGASWRLTPRAPGDFPRSLSIDDSGVVHAWLRVDNCHDGDYDVHARISTAGGAWTSADDSVAGIGHDTVFLWDLDERRELRVVASRAGFRRPLPPELGSSMPLSAHNGRVTYLLYASGLYRVREGIPTLASSEPVELETMVVDACDRVLGARGSALVRWSPSGGWRRLTTRIASSGF